MKTFSLNPTPTTRVAVRAASLPLLTLLLGFWALAILTGCNSPAAIDTPRTVTQDVQWTHTTAVSQLTATTTKATSVNGVKPEAEFIVSRQVFVTNGTIQASRYSSIFFDKESAFAKTFVTDANGAELGAVVVGGVSKPIQKTSYGGDNWFAMIAPIFVNPYFPSTDPLPLDEAQTVTWNLQRYTLSDKTIQLPETRRIALLKNPAGETMTVYLDKPATSSPEVVTEIALTITDGNIIPIVKTVKSGESAVQFTVAEMQELETRYAAFLKQFNRQVGAYNFAITSTTKTAKAADKNLLSAVSSFTVFAKK